MLVCHCHRVSDKDVSEVLAAGASKVGQVVRSTRAGTSCGGCLPELRRMCQQTAVTSACQVHGDRELISA